MQEQTELWSSGPGLFKALWRYKRPIVAAMIGAGALAYGLSFLLPVRYTAAATVILSDPRNAGVFRDTAQIVIDPNRYVRNQAERMESTQVLQRASELEGGRLSARTIASLVDAQPALNLDLITVSAVDDNPESAASLANSVVRAYEQVVVEEVNEDAQAAILQLDQSRTELEARVEVLEARLDEDPSDAAARSERDATIARVATLRDRAEQIAVDAALYGSGVEVFDEADTPFTPSSPNKQRNAALGAFLGLIAASGFAWWRVERTNTAEDRHDPAPIVRAPLLGEIFEFGKDEFETEDVFAPGSLAAEAYQFVFASLEFALDEGKSTVVAITSADQGDGKTISTANLAAAAAQTGRSVLVVDGDERMRGLTLHSDLPARPGLTDLVLGKAELGAATRRWRMAESVGVDFIPGGTKLDNPAGFFSTTAFRDMMDSVGRAADLVIIDTPPILAVADAAAIAARADGIVLVVNRGVPLQRLMDVRERLDSVGTPLLGYIFNRSNELKARYRYGYGYRNKLSQYGSGYGPGQNGERAIDRDLETDAAPPGSVKER